MKRCQLLFIILFAFISLRITAQQKEEDKRITDLNFLYADEKYEKLVQKATALGESDKYKRHPLPHIYAAIGYYEMSRRPGKYDVGEKDSKYPKPIKSAQKYLRKYDKAEGKAKKYFPDYEGTRDDYADFYEALTDTSNKMAKYYYDMGEYRKAASAYKSIARAVPLNPVLRLFQGISEVKSKNTLEGDKNIKAALKTIDEGYEPHKSTSGIIAQGMLIVEQYFTEKGDYANSKKAKKLVEVYKKYDPDELNKEKKEKREKDAKAKDEIMRQFYSDGDAKGTTTIENGFGSKTAEDELDQIEKEMEKENE